jgi:hypothetical protein
VMAIMLAKPLIPLGASLQRGCQGQETGVPLTDAISLQPAVVSVVGVGVIKTLSNPCRLRIGMDISQRIQHPPVVVWRNGSGVIPCLPEVPATPSKAVECHC